MARKNDVNSQPGSIGASKITALGLQGIKENGLQVNTDIFSSTLLSAPVRYDGSNEKIAAWLRQSGCSSTPHSIGTASRVLEPASVQAKKTASRGLPDHQSKATAAAAATAAVTACAHDAPSFNVTMEPGLRGLSWSIERDQTRCPLPDTLCGRKVRSLASSSPRASPRPSPSPMPRPSHNSLSMAACSSDDDDVATATDEQERQPEAQPEAEPEREQSPSEEQQPQEQPIEQPPEQPQEEQKEEQKEEGEDSQKQGEDSDQKQELEEGSKDSSSKKTVARSEEFEKVMRRLAGAAGFGAQEGAGLAGHLLVRHHSGFSTASGPLSSKDLDALIEEATARGAAFGLAAGAPLLEAAGSCGLGYDRAFVAAATLAFQVAATVAWWHVARGSVTAEGAVRVAVVAATIGLGGLGVGTLSLALSFGWTVTAAGMLAYKVGVVAGERVPEAIAAAMLYSFDKIEAAWEVMKEQGGKLDKLRQQYQQRMRQAKEAKSAPASLSPDLDLQPAPTAGLSRGYETLESSGVCVHFAVRLPASRL